MARTHHPSSREERLKLKEIKKLSKLTITGRSSTKRLFKEAIKDQETKEELHAGSQ